MLALEHTLRTLFAKPLAAAIFLTINGVILLGGEWVRRRGAVRDLVATHATTFSRSEEGRRLETLEVKEAVAVGIGDGVRGQAIVGAVFAGIAAFIAVRFLVRFFQSRNLLPFAIYCLVAGATSIIRFA